MSSPPLAVLADHGHASTEVDWGFPTRLDLDPPKGLRFFSSELLGNASNTPVTAVETVLDLKVLKDSLRRQSSTEHLLDDRTKWLTLTAGIGVKLMVVLQDLSQLKTHYPKSREAFLANAGVIQLHGANDATLSYFRKRLGDAMDRHRRITCA